MTRYYQVSDYQLTRNIVIETRVVLTIMFFRVRREN